MEKKIKYPLLLLPGAAYGALIILLSNLLIRNLGGIFGWIGGMTELDNDTVIYITQVLNQLKDAAIVSNWLPAILLGAVIGALFFWRVNRHSTKRIVIIVILWTLLFVPLTLTAMWFTEVNGVRMGAMLENLLPMISSLL